MKKCTAILFVLFIGVICSSQFARAENASVSIQPHFLQASLKSAGISSELILSSDTDFPCSLYIPSLHGSEVTLGFPAGGLLLGRPFSLEIDGMTALVQFTRDRKLEVVSGDINIQSIRAFSSVDCILTSIFNMADDILKNVTHLNIVGIVVAVLTGVVNILGCL